MKDSQKQEIGEIINMFLELKPDEEIAQGFFTRQLSYIKKQSKKTFG
jgi:hypothetical protein